MIWLAGKVIQGIFAGERITLQESQIGMPPWRSLPARLA
jgi:hypothetical protein